MHSSPSATILFFRLAHSNPPVVHYVAENSINSFENFVHFTSEWNFNLRAKRRNRSHRFHQHSVVYTYMCSSMLILSRQNRAIMKNSNDENQKMKIRKCERVEEKRNEIMNIDFVILRAFSSSRWSFKIVSSETHISIRARGNACSQYIYLSWNQAGVGFPRHLLPLTYREGKRKFNSTAIVRVLYHTGTHHIIPFTIFWSSLLLRISFCLLIGQSRWCKMLRELDNVS